MCALNICSSLPLFPPSMWPTLIINCKLLNSWREKRPRKACEKNTLWIYFSPTELYITIDRFISVTSQTYQWLFHVVSIPLDLFLWLRCFCRGPVCSVCLPEGSRCCVCVQMFWVYCSPITSFPNSHTANIYRGVSSLLLPQTCREANTLA